MKKRLLLPLAVFCIATLAYLVPNEHAESKADFRKTQQEHPFALRERLSPEDIKKMPKQDRPDLAWEQNFLLTMDPATGRPAPERLIPIYQQVASAAAAQRGPGAASTPWVERGPTNVGGRTRAIMYDPNDVTNKKVWAGGVTGGLWYNNDITNVSSTWVAVNDFWANIAVSAIAYDPTNTQIMYVGTGEGFGSGSGRGAGVWKSTDGGNSWAQLSASNSFYYVNDLVVTNEGGNGVLYVAVRGNYYQGSWHGSASSGLYRSTDDGSSFTSVLPSISGSSYAPADIEVSASNRIWIGTQTNSYGDGGGNVLYSDNGTSWTISYTSTGGERVELACAPSSNNHVYAMIESGNVISEMVKTTNAGSSWSNMSEPNDADSGIPSTDFSRGQAWYDMIIQVHPTNPNMVFTGAVDLFRTSNGGSTWDQIAHWYGGFGYPEVHADQHQMVFNPGNPNELIFGNDGGVQRTTNCTAGSVVFESLNRGYNVTQFYACALHPAAGSNYALAGSQDNGTQQFSTAGIGTTNEATGGDGAFCFVDQTDPTYQITSYVYNSYWRSVDGGASFQFPRMQSDQSTGRFINPTDYDDVQDALYSARTSSTINRIRTVSGTPNIDDFTVSGMNSMASHIRVSPYTTTSSTIFVGTGAGDLYKVTNANGSPSSTSIGSALPSGSISCVEIGASENELLVTLSNYGVTSVWYTSNGGSSWVSKEGNLPDMPIRWALFNPNDRNEVILATEVGVWGTSNIGVSSPNWTPSNSGLANVRVDMLQIRDSDKEVIAATFGRGLFTSNGFFQQVAPTANFGASVTNTCVGGVVSMIDSSSGGVSSHTWTFSPATFTYTGGTNANSANPQVIFNAPGAYTVTLDVTNSVGSDTKTRTAFINVGGAGLPFTEDFESGAPGWEVENPDGGITWLLYSIGGNSPGTNAAGVDNYNYSTGPGQLDALISPPLDFTGLSTVNLDFEYAYRRYSSAYQDSLAVYVSSDCGLNWTQLALYQEDGTGNFATGTDLSSNFSPSVAGDWCGGVNPVCPTINLDSYAGMSGIKIKFENISGYGNSLYVDNVNVTGVNSGFPATNFVAASTNFCEGASTIFTDQSTNSPTSWLWTVSPSTGVAFINGTSASSQNPEISFANAGSYSVSLDATNAIGSDLETKSNYITVNAPAAPSVTITESANGVCQGTSVSFTPTPINGGSSPMYSWKVNGSQVGTGATYTSSTLANGDIVTADLTSSETCVTTSTASSNAITMQVISNVTPSVSATASQNNVCEGTSITFTAVPVNGGSAPSYQWRVNGGNVGLNAATYTSSSLSNTDMVDVILTSSESCVTSATASSTPIIMTINAKPTVSIGSSPANDLCNGDQLTLTPSPAGGTLTGNGLTGNVFDADAAGTGVHQLIYTYTDGNSCVNADTMDVRVYLLPTPTVAWMNGDLTCNEPGYSYQWYNSSGAIPGAITQVYTPTLNDDYYVILSLGDCAEQSATTTVTGIHIDEWTVIKSLEIFPVPADNELNVRINALQFEQARFMLVDMLGKIYLEEQVVLKVGTNNLVFDVASLPSGTYMIRGFGEHGNYTQSVEIIH